MTKEKLIYLAIAIVSGVFFILYRDPLSLILLLVVLAVPLLLIVLTVLMRLGIRITVDAGHGVCMSGETAKISLVIANYSPLPISQIKVFTKYKNVFFEKADTGEFNFFAPPFSKNRYEIDVQSRHTGRVDVFFKKARVLDYLGVFSLPVRLKKTVSVSFLPKVHALEPTLRRNNYTASEATIYSKHKPGDDPSEVFAVREYVEGDKISRIHWKLTSKHEKYIVKDYSLPINESILILPELLLGDGEESDLDLVDAVLEAAFSLAHVLVERKTLQTIGYYNAEADKVCSQKINDLDDLYATFGDMFNTARYCSTPVLAKADDDLQQNMSHVVYIAANMTAERCAALTANKNDALLYTVINVVDDDAIYADMASEDLNILSVRKSGVGEALATAVL